jgi:hypothetical protein
MRLTALVLKLRLNGNLLKFKHDLRSKTTLLDSQNIASNFAVRFRHVIAHSRIRTSVALDPFLGTSLSRKRFRVNSRDVREIVVAILSDYDHDDGVFCGLTCR